MSPLVPDHVLSLPREQLTEFFLLFARFEFALKAGGFAKAGKRGAEVDWEKFSNVISDSLLTCADSSVVDAIYYLETYPPKQEKYENDNLVWCERTVPISYKRMRKILFHVQGARNNLVHGGKFAEKESQDPNCSTHLLVASECVISACIASCPSVESAFYA